MTTGVEVEGADQLAGALRGIAAGLPALTTAPQSAAQMIATDARSRAPKDTGALAGSLAGSSTPGVAEVGSPVSYGLPVHFGVPDHNQEPRPFLHQAVTAQQAQVVAAWADDAQRLIAKEV